ncbi:predicted protein [Botrytis cinerea T4]|uniref:Uncharacterized protein n=1 Tax=Botryotinia fuckeliana (strain T4) TaxID=999810 RepID=G2XYT1_BOTF4|nr:predicted protein [Botrytis cinerea T4]
MPWIPSLRRSKVDQMLGAETSVRGLSQERIITGTVKMKQIIAPMV